MSEAKHTPGPWKVDKNMIRAVDPLTSIACICDVAWPLGNRQECPEANAHLIAAAPEMLDALEYLLKQCEENERNNMNYMGVSEFAKERASKAIQKAKGVQE